MFRYIQIWLIVLLSSSFFSCYNYRQHIRDMDVDTKVDQELPLSETSNRQFIKSWQRWDIKHSSRMYDYELKEAELIDGIPCQGKITVDNIGKPYAFHFAKNHKFKESEIPKGSRFERLLNQKGENVGYMIAPSKPILVQGFSIRQKGSFLEDYHVDFYPQGQVLSFKPINDILIDNIPCNGGSRKSNVLLYPDGKLMSCYLSKAHKIHGKEFEKKERILIHKNGTIQSFEQEEFIKILRQLNII